MSNKVPKIVPPIWLYDARLTTVVVGTTPAIILPANPYRVSFVIGAGAATTVRIWPADLSGVSQGIRIADASGMFEIKWNDHPGILPLAWWAVDSVGGVTILIAESVAVR